MADAQPPSQPPAEPSSKSRWFVSAPAEIEIGPLLARLQQRGAEPYVLSDVAPLGANILQSIQHAISAADRVLVLLGTEAISPNSALEAGIAIGLGKPLVVVAAPQLSLPYDFAGVLTVHARPQDLDAIDFALDQAEGRADTGRTLGPSTGSPLGYRADQLLERAAGISKADPASLERSVIQVLVEALEDSGNVAVESAGPNRRFDLGVWSDDLDAIAANPLLIEIKRSLSTQGLHQALVELHSTPSARLALVIYVEPTPADDKAIQATRFPVLAISLGEMLEQMRTRSFAEVVRDLRNRSVHGLPPL